jgi:choline dehydrogenase-like flavoprotein
MTVHSGRLYGSPLELECDTVVVGSGSGGAPVAATLAEAGERVIVLEEGPNIPGDAHGKLRQSESVRHAWRDGAMTLAVGLGDSPSINVTAGRMVGGSSALTGGVCFRAPEHVLDEWAKELAIDDLGPKPMQRWFDQVAEDIHIEDVPESLRSKSTKLFAQGGEKLGIRFDSMQRNTLGCNGCGRCNFGCPHGAKLSVDKTYLPRAVAAGAKIFSDVLVEKIHFRGDEATSISGSLLDGPHGAPNTAVRIVCKRVVLAAGAMYTPQILARSGLGRRSGALGKNLTLHPSFRVIGRFDDPVRGWEGALQSAYTKHFEHDGMVFNSVFVPNGILAATMPGFGKSHAKLRQNVGHLAMFGVMIHDDGGGAVWNVPFRREPLMTYRMTKRDRPKVAIALERMAEIFFAAGAREVFLPVFGLDSVTPDKLASLDLDRVHGRKLECSSQHPLGTCHMGSSPDHSVVDGNGKVWDTRNVYVADGSILPTSLGVNPQWTIMAMALRVAWRLKGG